MTHAEYMYRAHRDSIFGVVLTKHFFERYDERLTLSELGRVLAWINRNVCIMLYELTLTEFDTMNYHTGDAIIVVSLAEYTKYPTIIVRTVYK